MINCHLIVVPNKLLFAIRNYQYVCVLHNSHTGNKMFKTKGKFLYILILCLYFHNAFAQHPIHIKGYIKEENTQITIPYPLISINNHQLQANENGWFEYTSESIIQSITINSLGYESLHLKTNIYKDTLLTFYLRPTVNSIAELQITANNLNQKKISGIQTFNKEELNNTTGILGQKDVIKAIQSLPGVGNAGEGNSGLLIRGGSAGQNLTLFNNAVIYNPSHLLGLFSVFNPAVTDEITIYKSGVPANHTGRLSSLLDIKSSRKLEDSVKFETDISPFSISTGAKVPINKNWTVGGWVRKTFMNQTVWPVVNKISTKSFFNKMDYDLYDINFISNTKVSNKDFLYLSAYSGGDDFGFKISNFDISNYIDWTNTALSATWKRYINNKIILENTAAFSGYRFRFGMEQQQYKVSINSKIKDFSYASSLNLNLGNHRLNTGLFFANHQYTPNSPYAKTADLVMNYGKPTVYHADETAIYITDEVKLSDKALFQAGIRVNYFRHKGPYTKIYKDGSEDNYSHNQTISDYLYVEPSLSLDYTLNQLSSVRATFARNTQPVHLVSVTAVNFPSDFWMPTVENMRPSNAVQGSLGYFIHSKNEKYNAFVEVFYKKMNHLTEFSGGMMNLIDHIKIEDNLYFGKGDSWGSEFFIKKNEGKIKGWLSYTFSFSNRKFPDINEGKRFPFKYDRRHDFSVNLSYSLNKVWNISTSFTYASGNAFTKPVSRYMIAGNIVNEYGNFNGSRMPPYHRMDISAARKLKSYKKFNTELSLSVYNVYNRQNPMYMFYMAQGDISTYQVSVQPKSVALLPILPSINYKITLK